MYNRSDLVNLPIEVLFNIFSYLPPEDVANVIIVNKELMKPENGNSFWQEKFKVHFPHLFPEISKTKNANWYSEFQKAYKYDYFRMPKETRNLFSLIKEGENEALIQVIRLEHLYSRDKNDDTLLDWAIKKDNQAFLDRCYQILASKYESGEDITERTILHWAILCKQPVNIINQLIQDGADVNAVSKIDKNGTALHLAASIGYVEVIDELLNNHNMQINVRDSEDNTPLHIAARYGELEAVKTLLANSTIDARNKNRETPLFVASYNKWFATDRSGQLEVVKHLLEKKANPNIANNRRETPLYMAAQQKGEFEIFKALLESGARHTQTTEGKTPLHIAVFSGQIEKVKAMLNAKPDLINMLDTWHGKPCYTPLHYAVAGKNLELVNELLERNADITTINMWDKTAYEMAIESGCDDIAEAIEKRHLLNYINKTSLREDDSYTVHKFLGFEFTFRFFGVPNAKEKKEAMKALYGVVFDHNPETELDKHERALNQGELGIIKSRLLRK